MRKVIILISNESNIWLIIVMENQSNLLTKSKTTWISEEETDVSSPIIYKTNYLYSKSNSIKSWRIKILWVLKDKIQIIKYIKFIIVKLCLANIWIVHPFVVILKEHVPKVIEPVVAIVIRLAVSTIVIYNKLST
jgi:hypothetical protein